MAAVKPRRDGDRPEVWALPKGLVDPHEGTAETALREGFEETGVRGRLGPKLGDVRYVYTWAGERVFKVMDYGGMAGLKYGAKSAEKVRAVEDELLKMCGEPVIA